MYCYVNRLSCLTICMFMFVNFIFFFFEKKNYIHVPLFKNHKKYIRKGDN